MITGTKSKLTDADLTSKGSVKRKQGVLLWIFSLHPDQEGVGFLKQNIFFAGPIHQKEVRNDPYDETIQEQPLLFLHF